MPSMPKRNGLIYASMTVLYVGSLLEFHLGGKGLVPRSESGKGNEPIVKKWIAITILAIVLGFTAEQAPEVGNGLALLILIAGIIRYSKVFSITFNQTQGSTK